MPRSARTLRARTSIAHIERQSLHRERYWAICPSVISPVIDVAQPQNVTIEFDNRMNADDDVDEVPVVDGVAIIDVVGVLRKNPTLFDRLFGGGTSYGSIALQVNQVANDPSVRAIVLRIDSPGGTVSGGSDAVDELQAARRLKPVVAYGSDLVASAAYRLASQASAIICDRDCQVGSIGTFAVIHDMSKMADEMGIKVHVVKAGAFKGAGEPGTDITDDQLGEWQREVDALNALFLEEIVAGRGSVGLSMDRVRELADGRIHIGKAAVANGLIDAIGSIDDAIDRAVALIDDHTRQQIRDRIVQSRIRAALNRQRQQSRRTSPPRAAAATTN